MLSKTEVRKRSLANQAKHRRDGKTSDWLRSYSRGFGKRFDEQLAANKRKRQE